MEEVLAAPQTELSLAEKVFGLRVALHYNCDSQRCDPSLKGIAERTGLKLRTVNSAKNKFVRSGRLLVVKNSGGRGIRNNYRLLMTHVGQAAESEETVHLDALFSAQTVHPDALNSANGDTKQCIPVHSNKKNRKEQEARPFDRFWRIYPRPEAEGLAEKLFEQAIRTGQATAEELISGAERYAAESADTARRYIRGPKAWFEGRCWKDAQRSTSEVMLSGTSTLRSRQEACVSAWAKSPPYNRSWHDDWDAFCGGPPDSPHCTIPDEIFTKYGLRKGEAAA
jgi:hypothetical protein